ncbi:hypothetical protein PVAP13_9KG101720, partial [Panicum virgatum]
WAASPWTSPSCRPPSTAPSPPSPRPPASRSSTSRPCPPATPPPWTRWPPRWARRAGSGASSLSWATACRRRPWRARRRRSAPSSRSRRRGRRPCAGARRRRSGTTSRSTPRTSGTGRRCSTSSRASRRGRRRGRRVREQVARGPARLQRGAGGVHGSAGGDGVQAAGAAGAAGPEPGPEARPAARLLQGAHHVLPAEPLPSLPEPGAGAGRGAAQGPRGADHPVPGRRRRARRPAALRRRVGPRQGRPRLLHHQRRRHDAGVEQRPVRERGAPGVGEPGQGAVLHALLLQPGGRRRGGAAGGAGRRGGPAQVQRLQLGRLLPRQAQRQLQEEGRGEPPDRAFQEG